VRGVEARVVVAREGGGHGGHGSHGRSHGASDAAAAAAVVLENGNLALTFDARSGLLSAITNKAASPSGLSANVSQNLHQYMPADDGTDGAYSFRPVAGGTLDVGACCADPKSQAGSCPGLPPSTAAQGCKNVKKKDYALFGPAARQPVLLVTTRSQGGATSYGDVTTATTRNVSATNASFNVARPVASGSAWGQDVGAAVLELDAAAGPGNGAGLHAGFVAGSAGAGGSALDWATVEVAFDAAALAELGAGDDAGVRMLVTPRLGDSRFSDSDGSRDAIFAASPLALSGAGATLLVRKVQAVSEAGGGVPQPGWPALLNLTLDWVAWRTGACNRTAGPAGGGANRACVEGSFATARTGNDTTGAHLFGSAGRSAAGIAANARLFANARYAAASAARAAAAADGGGAIALTLTGFLNGSGFGLNVIGVGHHLPQGLPLRIDWLAVAPLTQEWPVLRDPRYLAAAAAAGRPAPAAAPNLTLVTGPVVSELHQVFRPGYAQTWRLPTSAAAAADVEAAAAELTVMVGPLDEKRELVARFETELPTMGYAMLPAAACGDVPAAARTDCGFSGITEGECRARRCCWDASPSHDECFVSPAGPARRGAIMHPDANGLEYVRRVADAGATEPVAANYFPVGQAVFIQDEGAAAAAAAAGAAAGAAAPTRQLSVVCDRSHGVAALRDGELEVMLHRRCAADDHKGVGETLNEEDQTTTQLYVSLDAAAGAARLRRTLGVRQNFVPSALFFPEVAGSGAPAPAPSGVLLAAALPPNVHLLSLEQRYGAANDTVLRLQHLYEGGEHVTLAQPVTVDLRALFNASGGLRVQSAVEMLLGANAAKASVQAERLRWKAAGEGEGEGGAHALDEGGPRTTFRRPRWWAGVPSSELPSSAGGGSLEDDDDLVVTLHPRQIRTWLLNAQPVVDWSPPVVE
jgi:hypothetical protein